MYGNLYEVPDIGNMKKNQKIIFYDYYISVLLYMRVLHLLVLVFLVCGAEYGDEYIEE